MANIDIDFADMHYYGYMCSVADLQTVPVSCQQ